MLQSNLAAKAEQLNLRFAGLPAASLLKEVFANGLLGRAALVSSFGGEAAVLLHMLSKIAPKAPILLLIQSCSFPRHWPIRPSLPRAFSLSMCRDCVQTHHSQTPQPLAPL
jgi:phosphoadenosine phosphosulfate reductase